MHIFSLRTWLTSTPAARVVTESEEILELLSASGEKAFAAQEALMISWSKKLPPADSHPAIIAQLAKNMLTNRATSLTYRILCTLWISKLDPKDGHALRVSPINALLISNYLDAHSHELFKAFAHELNTSAWDFTANRMKKLLLPRNEGAPEHKIQALRILAIAFQHVSPSEQQGILISVFDEFSNQVPTVRNIVPEALGEIFSSINQEKEFVDTRNDSMSEEIIRGCIERVGSKDLNTHNTALLSLAKIVPHAKGQPRMDIINKCIAKMQTPSIHDVGPALTAACACFNHAKVTDQNKIIFSLMAYITHKDKEFREPAAASLIKIYPQAAMAEQNLITTTLEAALLESECPKMQIAQTLRNINYKKPTGVESSIEAVLKFPALEPQSKALKMREATLNEEMWLMMSASTVNLEHYATKKANETVHDHLITFLARTRRDVNLNYSANEKPRVVISHK